MLRNKTRSTFLATLVIVAVQLTALEAFVLARGDTPQNERESPEDAFQAALVLYDTEQHQHAWLRLQEAMRSWIRIGERGKAAKAALQMGDRYKQARQYKDALRCYEGALGVESLPGSVRAQGLCAIGLGYSELYENDLAIQYFRKALDQARIVNDAAARTDAFAGLANLYCRQGNRAEALKYVLHALRSSKQAYARPNPALLYLAGRIKQDEGSAGDAIRTFEEALEAFAEANDVEGQVRTLCALSNLSLLSSQTQSALEHAECAVDMAENQAKAAVSHADKDRARELRWQAWLSRARAERAMGQKNRAIKSYFWAINHFEGVWWAEYLATEASAIAFREESQAAYREYIDLLMEQGQFEQAYELADGAKARSLLNTTEVGRVRSPSNDPHQRERMRDQSRLIAGRRLQLLAADISPRQQMSLRRQIEDAEYEMREVQVQAELAHYTDRLVWSKLATVEELRKETATNRTALAEFSLGDNRSFVWLFVHGHVFFETLPSRGEIEKAVRKYLGLLSAGPGYGGADRDLAVLGEQSKKLVQMLFGHLFKEIDQVERVIIVPDGLLNYLPFEALIRNGRYLVEDHQISYSPSASLLGLWEDVGLRADSGNKMDLFALGDPVFEPKGRAIGSKRRGDRARFGGRTFPGPGSHLASLPRTRDEVEYIASLFPADRRKVIVGMASTEEAVKHEPLARYRRLHFATHSLIDEKLPSRSAVVLTLDNDPREDGFLEAGEISHLDLDCDLVVLSGCQTGKGQLLSGEGIVGLGRAFLCAGARSVVVSLWNVSDISTSHLMKNFYQHLVHGEGNAAALRAAKLQMLNSGRETRHPYYWAPFVVIGSP